MTQPNQKPGDLERRLRKMKEKEPLEEILGKSQKQYNEPAQFKKGAVFDSLESLPVPFEQFPEGYGLKKEYGKYVLTQIPDFIERFKSISDSEKKAYLNGKIHDITDKLNDIQTLGGSCKVELKEGDRIKIVNDFNSFYAYLFKLSSIKRKINEVNLLFYCTLSEEFDSMRFPLSYKEKK